jgi:branched-chain amino acid transport system ATP-binding protein
MLAVARALVPDNKLLLIDEPSEGLAPILIQQMMDAIRSLSEKTTILLVEQNFIMASQLAQRFTIIDDGQSVHEGMMENLVNDEEMIHQYLGASIKTRKELEMEHEAKK